MIVAVVVARANIDVAIQTIQRKKGVKLVEIHVFTIPLHGLSPIEHGGAERIPI